MSPHAWKSYRGIFVTVDSSVWITLLSYSMAPLISLLLLHLTMSAEFQEFPNRLWSMFWFYVK